MNGQPERAVVLAVDDEPRILGAIQDLLEEEFEVIGVERAEQALALLEQRRVAVIISDQRMPGMNGDEFLARAHARHPGTRILLTGYADFSAVVRAVNEGGIFAYVAKPWDPDQFRLLVRRAAENSALLAALAHERQLLQQLMDSVPDEICFKDAGLRFLRVNRAMLRRLGVESADGVVGRRLTEVVDTGEAAAIEAEEAGVLEAGAPLVDRLREIPAADGSRRWYSRTAVTMVDADGRPGGLVCIGRDVDERQRAASRLRESEARFRDFTAIASDWFWETDADLRFTVMHPRVEAAIGLPAATYIGKRREETDHVEAEGHSMAEHLRQLAERRPFRDFVFGRPLPNGRTAWVAVSGAPRFDDDGRFLGYRGTGRDVTPEREALRRLRLSEQAVRMLLDSTAEGIYGVDRDGRCTFCNPSMLRMLGYEDASELLGRGLHDIIHHSRADGTPLSSEECRLVQALAEGRPLHAPDEVYWRRDGSPMNVDVRLSPVRRDDAIDGAVISFTDVTAEHRAQAAVALVNDIAVALGNVADIRSALRITLALVRKTFGWALGEAWQRVAGEDYLECTAVEHDPTPAIERYVAESVAYRFDRGDGLPGRVWESRRPEWVPDIVDAPHELFRRHGLVRHTGLRGACGVPVASGEETVAVLVFYAAESREDDDMRVHALTAAVAPLAAFLKRIAAEDALREVDARMNLALEAAGVGTWEWLLDVDQLRWDEHMERLYGAPPGAGPRDIEEFGTYVHPDDLAPLTEEVRAAIEDGSLFAAEFRIVRRDDGRVRWLAGRGLVYRDAAGTPLRMSGANWDVSAQREAQVEIEDLARFYRDNPHPVLRIGADGRILLANEASRTLLGHWQVAIGEHAPEPLAGLLPQVLAAGEPTAFEVAIGERTLRLSLVPVSDTGYLNVYGEDVSAERRSQQRLRQAQKMEAVGELTGGIAHDFNNRLTVISGNLELLELELPADAPAVELVRHARHATDGASKLVRQLLTYARRQVDEPELVDVNDRLRGLSDMLRRSLGEPVDLRLDLCASTWPVYTDAGQFEDAVINLCVNARDAMPEGGSLVIHTDNVRLDAFEVRDRPYVRPGDYVLVAVTDTGCGMSRDVLERVFEPFFTTKPEGKGTGLGLSMVYGFAKQSGGHVYLYSEPGHGTSVKLYLPRRERRVQPRDGAAGPTPALRSSGRVLVVEDDAGVRRVASGMLGTLGYTVVAVENGPAAIARLEEDPAFDLVFTDVVMPGGMSGFDLVNEVRRRWPGLRCLLTSGYSDRGPFRTAVPPEDVAWVIKPYVFADLAARVSAVLGEAPAAEGGDDAAAEPPRRPREDE